MTRLSLRMRLAMGFGGLMVGIAVFMMQFFPARMAEQAGGVFPAQIQIAAPVDVAQPDAHGVAGTVDGDLAKVLMAEGRVGDVQGGGGR